MLAQTFYLPVPPSLNNAFINIKGRGRIKSPEYRAWTVEAGYRLKGQGPVPIKGPVMVSIIAIETNLQRDIDNLIKPVLDLLVAHQIIEGDHAKCVRAVAARWSTSDNLKGLSVEIVGTEKD